jgi:hypothetical protein
VHELHHGTRVLLAAVALLGCTGILPTAIAKITANPREYVDKTVLVRGEVTEAASLVVFKYFELRDATGTIYVKTDRTLPNVGRQLTVKGVVRELDFGPLGRLIAIEEQADR